MTEKKSQADKLSEMQGKKTTMKKVKEYPADSFKNTCC